MIRRIKKKDRAGLVKLINSNNIFKKSEMKVAVDLIDEALELEKPDEYDYNIFVYVEGNEVKGYHCTGKRYMTKGVFDLYWIMVDQKEHGKGIGKKLLKHADRFVRKNDGYLIIAETSSTKKYNSTRQFYLKNRYKVLAEIKDFYKFNDNLIIFGKYLTT